ncbi:MAG TPA: hypothetical protein VGJ18_06285 [Gemmatimonadaceae bacterium]|jgi:hypothetical protein
MSFHKPNLLRREWSLFKNGGDVCCEIWSAGPFYEARLVKSGSVILRDRSRWAAELRREYCAWRHALEMLGWKQQRAVDRFGTGSRG